MSQNTLPEKPLFSKNKTSTNENTLSIEELEKRNAIKRKNILQQFGIDAFYKTLSIIAIFVIVDIVLQELKIESKLLGEAFEVVKYATTTILGFLFANKSE